MCENVKRGKGTLPERAQGRPKKCERGAGKEFFRPAMNQQRKPGVVRVRLLYLHCVLFKVLELMLQRGPDCEIQALVVYSRKGAVS